MKYIIRYDTFADFASAETVTASEERVSSVTPGIAGIRNDLNKAWFNRSKPASNEPED